MLTPIGNNSSLQIQGRTEMVNGFVQLVSDREDLNIAIPIQPNGEFNYYLTMNKMPSARSQWHILQLRIPGGEKKGAWSTVNAFDPAAPVRVDLLANDAFLTGFYDIEVAQDSSWRWSTGIASVVFPLLDYKRDLYLRLTLDPPLRNPDKLKITFNEHVLGPFSFGKSGKDVIHFRIPYQWMIKNGKQTLQFSAESINPAKEGITEDTRDLGLRIFEIKLADKRE
jgi:hypothetical protein